MKREPGHRPNAREYVSGLAANGRYDFTSREAQSALGVSADAAKLALNRLEKKKLIASPARGFYVSVPPEYRSRGYLPAGQFIPALMKRLNLPYYAGLLSAVQYRGASATAAIPGFRRKDPSADPMWNRASRLHGAQASCGCAGSALQHAERHIPCFDT